MDRSGARSLQGVGLRDLSGAKYTNRRINPPQPGENKRRLFERAVVVAALFVSRQAAKAPRGRGVANDHRDAELGWVSLADANGLDVGDDRACAGQVRLSRR